MAAANANSTPPAPVPGTSLMDRINVAIHLRRYLKLIGQRWWIIFLCAAAAGGYSSYKAFTTPDRFMAWSKLTIAPRLETARPRVQEELNSYYDRQLVLMKNEAVMKKIFDRLQRYTAAPARVPWYSADASVDRASSSFTLTVRSTDLDFATHFAKTWADAFIEYKTEVVGGVVSEAARETAKQIQRLQKQWDDINKQMTEFRTNNNVANAKAVGDAAQARLSELEHKYEATKQEREILQGMSREQIAEGGLTKNTPKSAPGTPGSDRNSPGASASVDTLEQFSDNKYLDLQGQLKFKQADRERLRPFLKPEHPRWLELSAEIESLTQQVQNQLDQIEKRRKARIQALVLEEQTMLPMIEKSRKEAFRAQDIQQQFSQLQEKETRIKNALDTYEQEKMKIDLTSSTEDTIEPVERGRSDPVAYEPRRARIIWQGLLFGLVVGAGIVYLLHRLDDRLDLAEDIEAELDEPVLGQIPQMDSTVMRDGRLLITRLEHHNMFAESIRGVRSAIKFGAQGSAKQIMLVSSAVPGDGKTTFTVNFAATLANAGHRVLLIDADLRRGNTHSFFDHPREPGLSEILTGQQHWTDVVRNTEINTLRAIHTGQIPANPGELLIGPVTRELVNEVKREFDFVVFDCPPLTSLDDTFSLVDLADGLIFVVKSGQTSMRFAKNALAAVRQRSFPILGIVLNGITADNPYYYYSNYYHAYYSKEQPAPAASTVTGASPPARMAAPRRQREPVATTSIEAQAKIRSGESASHTTIVAEEEAKLHAFRARRATGKEPHPSPTSAGRDAIGSAPVAAASPSRPPQPVASHPVPRETVVTISPPNSSRTAEPTPVQSPPPAAVSTPEPSLDTELKSLKQLLEGGLITQQDFDARKQKKINDTMARLRVSAAAPGARPGSGGAPGGDPKTSTGPV